MNITDIARKYWNGNHLGQALSETGKRNGAQAQMRLYKAMLAVAHEYGRYSQDNPDLDILAAGIYHQQCDKIAMYGEKAFPWTDRQIAVLVSDLKAGTMLVYKPEKWEAA
jgi:hypothetical protein